MQCCKSTIPQHKIKIKFRKEIRKEKEKMLRVMIPQWFYILKIILQLIFKPKPSYV